MELVKLTEQRNDINAPWEVVIGPQAKGLIDRQNNLDQEEKETVLTEAAAILENCANPSGISSSNTGLAIGYVQSGKTLSFTTLTALAKDNGYKVVIIIAGTGNNLLEQTSERLKKDLLTNSENSRDYKVYTNPQVSKNGDNDTISRSLRLTKTSPLIIITVLKHHHRIDLLTQVLNTREVRNSLNNKAVLIIDDEADQASLNTYARSNSKSPDWQEEEFSSTYINILNLRKKLPNHSFVQYTATPQAPLLINIMDIMSPDFHKILTPGKTYTGGNTFFGENKKDLIEIIPDNEVYHHSRNQLGEIPESLKRAIIQYFLRAAVAVEVDKKSKQVSMMIHAAREVDASSIFYSWVNNMVTDWTHILELNRDNTKDELLNDFHKEYNLISICQKTAFQDLMIDVKEIMLDTNIEKIVQDNNFNAWGNHSSHIVIGADKLNRGFTVEGLIVTYMTRHNLGKSNADTIQQRCRFFGYKEKLLPYCQVFLPESSIYEYEQYVEHEESLRNALKDLSLDEFSREMILDSSMNPTRNNILSKELVRNKMNGWRQFNAVLKPEENNSLFEAFIQTIIDDFREIKDFVKYRSSTEDRTHRIAEIDITTAIVLLSKFKVTNLSDSMRKSATLQYLNYWKDKGENKCYFVDMAYRNSDGRERSVIFENNTYQINNIWSGRSTKSVDEYPGDKAMMISGKITLQLHRIKVKSEDRELRERKISTLGIYYPPELELNFVGQ